MRIPRFYCPELSTDSDLMSLPIEAHRHAVQVLRLKVGAKLTVFNGEGLEYQATLYEASKRQSMVQLADQLSVNTESTLDCTLLQGISRGERMDYTIQKAVELGVRRIVPVMTERCNVALSGERAQKKLAHWRGIMVSACEQSGRSVMPELAEIMTLDQVLLETKGQSFVLDPEASMGFYSVELQGDVSLLIGPEGGLSEQEIALATSSGMQAVRFGPRILRTETAAVAALAVIQTLWGDLG